MFGALASAVQNLHVPAEPSALIDVAALQDRLVANTTMAVAELDAAGAYEIAGAATMTAWMRTELGLTNTQANRILRTARRIRRFPHTAEAWQAGRLSSGQIECIVANVTERRAPIFEDQE